MLCLREFSRVVVLVLQGPGRVVLLSLRLIRGKALKATHLKVRVASAHHLILRDLRITNRGKRAPMPRGVSGEAMVGPIRPLTCVRDRVGPVSRLKVSILGLPTHSRAGNHPVSRLVSLAPRTSLALRGRKDHKGCLGHRLSKERKCSRALLGASAATGPTR